MTLFDLRRRVPRSQQLPASISRQHRHFLHASLAPAAQNTIPCSRAWSAHGVRTWSECSATACQCHHRPVLLAGTCALWQHGARCTHAWTIHSCMLASDSLFPSLLASAGAKKKDGKRACAFGTMFGFLVLKRCCLWTSVPARVTSACMSLCPCSRVSA